MCRHVPAVAAGSSLAFIGKASAEQGGGADVQHRPRLFRKETRRKPLAFAADFMGFQCRFFTLRSVVA